MKRDEENTHVTTRDGYACWAGHYDDHDNPMTAMVEHVLAQAPVDLDGAKVLELGCGTGRNALALQGMGCASYLGIDNSPEMLDVVALANPWRDGTTSRTAGKAWIVRESKAATTAGTTARASTPDRGSRIGAE